MNKLKNYYPINLNFFLIYFIGIFFYTINSGAKESINEKIFEEITKNLRCMTCQNQTVYESDTEFSKQIKMEVIKQLGENKTKEEITSYIVDRYGEYILLKPKFNKKNLFLWIFPFTLITASFLIFFLKLRKK